MKRLLVAAGALALLAAAIVTYGLLSQPTRLTEDGWGVEVLDGPDPYVVGLSRPRSGA